MKSSRLASAMVLVLSIAGSACQLVAPASPPSPPEVVFTAVPGAPAFPPTRALNIVGIGATPPAGIVVDSRGARASKDIPSPEAPHVKLGDLLVRPVGGSGPGEKKMRKAIEDEARRRGATWLVYTHCDALECEAAMFRLSSDVNPGRPASSPPADTAVMTTNIAGADGAGGNVRRGPAPNVVLADTIDGAPAVDPRWIAENAALGKALVGLWMPDDTGSIPNSAHDVFEKELLRSRLYINAGKKDPPKHQGNLVVYTDSASLAAVDGAGSKPYGLPPGEIFQLALDMNLGVYLHYEGDASVFTTLDKDNLKALLARLAKKPSP